ncbi:hypothetical protein [Novosphingobium album (ex Liu et al. 2023)]|uniref:Cytochrome c n=1 Tax=Novosphingobium album (ex Liu et al. 2023) TaxID=3031130 RepID=A0ABT5WME8_9SPHN|nr:hypothetical protein [Novosphingobium album (ex Liu et al. 2023)]MDE8651215.1 hypothetical protein [Novosphingobium album (ex Liu et al. 2023)]
MAGRTQGFAPLAAGLIGIAAFVLIVVGPPGSRKPAPPPPVSAGPPPSSVSANGFTLTSATMDLPADDATYPDGPNADLVNARCSACHSPSMVLTQPAFPAEKWQEIVLKMRDVYHAPIAEQDIAPITQYLAARPVAD